MLSVPEGRAANQPRRVVLEAPVLRRVVGRRDHDPVGEPAAPAPVVPEHRVRHDAGAGFPASGLISAMSPPPYFTMQGFAFQMSAAYSAMVRSLENFPDPATLRMAFRAQPSWSAYSAPSRWLASRYDRRSARCM